MPRVDVHNHFLPGIDDGCRDVKESLACLRVMADNGYDRAFCTPHSGDTEFTDLSTDDVKKAVAELQKKVTAAAIPITLRPGGEIRLSVEMPDHLRSVGIPSFGHSGKYVLVDIWDHNWPTWAVRAIEWLQKQSLTVIMAHPERMPVLRRKPEIINEIAALGLLFQGNLQPVAQKDAPDINALAERFLKDGRYFMLGSDAHRIETLPPRIEGLAMAEKFVGAAAVARLTVENPGKLWQ
jgi:protein-tyrosine phosphatase